SRPRPCTPPYSRHTAGKRRQTLRRSLDPAAESKSRGPSIRNPRLLIACVQYTGCFVLKRTSFHPNGGSAAHRAANRRNAGSLGNMSQLDSRLILREKSPRRTLVV